MPNIWGWMGCTARFRRNERSCSADSASQQKKTGLAPRRNGPQSRPKYVHAASYAPDRKRLQELVDLANAGDAAALRAYAIKVYYSAALEMDRFRHRCIIALEARARQAQAGE